MSHRTLTRNGYIVHKKYLTPFEINKIKKDLTVTPAVLPAFKDLAKPKPYKVFLESPERYYLPRYYGIEHFGQPVNVNILDGEDIDITVHMTLRPHQIAAAKNIMKQFNKPWIDSTANNTIINVATNVSDSVDSRLDNVNVEEERNMAEDSTQTDEPSPLEILMEVNNLHSSSKEENSKTEEEPDEEELEYKASVGGGGVLSLPCGYGKTVLAIWTIAQLKKKTLVIVNKEFLMDQWIDSFDKFSNARVGILQQNKMEIDGNDVVVGMLHSICMKEYPKGMFDSFGLVIFDECHHIASDMFSKSLPKVASKYMLGLSATPERKDKLSRVFYYYLGKLFHQERRAGSNLVMVKQIHCMSNSPYYQDLYLKNGVKNTGGMLTQLIEFEARNKMIIHILSVLVKQSRTTLVLSSRREHLEWIYDALQKANLRRPNGTFVTFGLYWGKQQMNKKQYKKMLEESAKCDIVLGTCQLAQEGLDIPTLDTLLFATPMTDIIQAVGRILRKYHAINPYVIDIVDKFGNFPKHLKQRQEFYDEEEYFCERTNTFLFDSDTDNKYEELITGFLDHLPDLTEFEASRGQAGMAGKKHRKGPLPRLFILGGEGNGEGNGGNGGNGGDNDDMFKDDEDEDAPTTIRLPGGCLLEGVSADSGNNNSDSNHDKRIPIKITPKLPSLTNKVKISSTMGSNVPKLQVSDTITPVQKVKVTDLKQASPVKVKISPTDNLAPKIKVVTQPTNVPKIKVSDMVVNTTTKVKVLDPQTALQMVSPEKIKVVNQIADIQKIKIGEINNLIQDELQTQKVKITVPTPSSLIAQTKAANTQATSSGIATPALVGKKILPIQRKFF